MGICVVAAVAIVAFVCDATAADTASPIHQRRFSGGGVANQKPNGSASTICVVMTSVQRDVENYAEGTVANLLNALPRTTLPVHVVVGGSQLQYLSRVSHMHSIAIYPWLPSVDDVRRRVSIHYTASANYARALGAWRSICTNDTIRNNATTQSHRGLLIVEDDVVLADAFYETLSVAISEAELLYDTFWLDCYVSSRLTCSPLAADVDAPHVGQYDAQCCPLCRYYSPTAAVLLHDELVRHLEKYRHDPPRMLPHDIIAVEFARQHIAMLCVVPRDLVQHVGDKSSGLDAQNSVRQSKTFVYGESSVVPVGESHLPTLAHLFEPV